MPHSFFHTAPPMLPFHSEDVRNARRRTIFLKPKPHCSASKGLTEESALSSGGADRRCSCHRWARLSESTNCRKPASIISKSAVIPFSSDWSTICCDSLSSGGAMSTQATVALFEQREDALIRASQRGDIQAAETLFGRYRRSLLRTAL